MVDSSTHSAGRRRTALTDPTMFERVA